jgi:uncharacterized protein (TIGR00725 family)
MGSAAQRLPLCGVRRRVVGVMGAGEHATPQAIDWARRIGALIAEQGWVVLSGGRNAGVMDAVSAGAHKAGGTVVGIMPTSDATEASDFLDIAIVTGMGSARNNINILSSDVVVACGNAEAGTLSEIALAFKARKPVVLLTEDAEATRFLERTGRGLLHAAHTPEQAITLVHGLLETL